MRDFSQQHKDLVDILRYVGPYPREYIRLQLHHRGKSIGTIGFDVLVHYPPDPALEVIIRLGGTP